MVVARLEERQRALWLEFCSDALTQNAAWCYLFTFPFPLSGRVREIATCRQRSTAEVAVCKNDLYAVEAVSV
jgi:hypothetical protein